MDKASGLELVLQDDSLPDMQALVRVAIEQSFNPVLITDASTGGEGEIIRFANHAFCDMTGYQLDELLGQTPRILQGPQTSRATLDALRKALDAGESYSGTAVNYRKDGLAYDVEWRISPILNSAGVVTHYISIQQDISELIASKKTEALLLQALDASQVATIIVDHRGIIEFANQGFCDLFGYRSDEVLGKDAQFVKADESADYSYACVYEQLQTHKSYEVHTVNRHSDGSKVYCDEKISPLYDCDGAISHYVAVMKNVTKHIKREQALEAQALTDPLTALYNRRAGQQELVRAYQRALEEARPFCVVMADIDKFKPINDNFGHQRGDEILQEIANHIAASIRESDTAVRWGGEEFLMLLEDCKSVQVEGQINKLREQIAQLDFDDVGRVTMSFGIAHFPDANHAPDLNEALEDVITRADRALYEAKRNGRNRVVLG